LLWPINPAVELRFPVIAATYHPINTTLDFANTDDLTAFTLVLSWKNRISGFGNATALSKPRKRDRRNQNGYGDRVCLVYV
jgi:hypothetical protein